MRSLQPNTDEWPSIHELVEPPPPKPQAPQQDEQVPLADDDPTQPSIELATLIVFGAATIWCLGALMHACAVTLQ